MPFGIDNCSLTVLYSLYEGELKVPTLESVLEPLERIEIILPPRSDTREIFRRVAEVYEGRKVELTEEGHVIVMAPTGLAGGILAARYPASSANGPTELKPVKRSIRVLDSGSRRSRTAHRTPLG
ncbi:MAG: hypothetical protein ACJ746_04325 [Bryobacteraceae bacterium]